MIEYLCAGCVCVSKTISISESDDVIQGNTKIRSSDLDRKDNNRIFISLFWYKIPSKQLTNQNYTPNLQNTT